jgi:hypothetical protein
MNYSSFEFVMSSKRMERYLIACSGDKRRAQTLYRLNLHLSQEMFTVISCYEVALRNAIDRIMTSSFGPDWLRDAILPGGLFDNPHFLGTTRIMNKAYGELVSIGKYSCSKMLSAMEFGIWKYMYSAPQYRATGRKLLNVFPNKPKSSAQKQYNNLFIFNELDAINRLRNRIAHHEPICFQQNQGIISTEYLLSCYNRILDLFYWMGIDAKSLLYGLDHIQRLARQIDHMKQDGYNLCKNCTGSKRRQPFGCSNTKVL